LSIYRVDLVILNDDYSGFTRLLSSHGLSIYLRMYSDNGYEDVLFDVGPSNYILKHNSMKLSIDLSSVKAVILSHRHYDHTGGLKYVMKVFRELGGRPTIIAHPWIFKPSIVLSHSKQEFDKGLPYSEEFIRANANLILTRNPLRIANSAFYLGEIGRYVDVSKYKSEFHTVLDDGELVPDELPDDTGLAIDVEGLGLVVVAGCSHSGIVNIVRHASELLKENVYAVVGGFHMMKYDDEDLRDSINALKELGVGKVYTGHCTGLKAEKLLSDAFNEGFIKIHSGFRAIFKA